MKLRLMNDWQNGGILISILAAFIGFTLWSVGDAFIRYFKDYPVPVIVVLSNGGCLLLLVLLSNYLGGFKKTLTKPKLKMRIARGACLSISNLLGFIAFMNLDLATAYALIFCAPFMAKIFSVLLMGEQIRLRSWVITCIGFIGVLIVVRPGMIPLNIGTAAALGLTVFFSLGYVLGRYIGPDNQTLLSMTIFQFLIMFCIMLFPAISLWHTVDVTMQDLGIFAFMSLCFVAGSILVAKAFAHAPAAYIAPVHYVQILWGVLLGAVMFGEYPDNWTIAGGSIIVIAGLLLIKFSRRVVA